MNTPMRSRERSSRVLIVGAGEGGQQALLEFFRMLPHVSDPVVVVQRNMPAGFVSSLAELIARATGHHCREAVDGEALSSGVIRLIPAGLHGRIVRTALGLRVALSGGARINGSCPALDPLLASAAEACGAAVVAVVFGGKGRDGCDGCDDVAAAGGTILLQDPGLAAYPEMPRTILQRHPRASCGTPSVLAKAAAPGLTDALVVAQTAVAVAQSAPWSHLVAVGSSTGGPAALLEFFDELPPDFAEPIVIVQHMPPGFPARLAASLGSATGRKIHEIDASTRLERGITLIAPGDQHVRIVAEGNGFGIRLDHGAPVDGNRPSVDTLFATAAAAVKRAVMAVVLTGVGNDGLAGSRAVVGHGGTVIVQDEASSLVWGMPGAVARAGIATIQRRPGALAAWLGASILPPAPAGKALSASIR